MADLTSFVKNELAPALNSHNIDRLLQYFDDNAVVNFPITPPGLPGNTLKGKEQIRQYLDRFIQGAHVEPRDIKSTGDQVEWKANVSSDMLKQFGVGTVEGKVTATVKNNKITSFSPMLPQDVINKIQQAGGGQKRAE